MSLRKPRRRPRRAARVGRTRARTSTPTRAGLDDARAEVEAAEIRKMLGGEHDRAQRHRHHPSRRRRHRVAGLGGDAAADVPALDRAARLQARDHRLSSRAKRRASRASTFTRDRRLRVRAAVGRSRRPSAGAHLAVRSGGAPPHLVRLGLRLAGAARGHRHRDRRKGPPHRHLPLERRRRPARQRHGLGRPHHAPADRHRRVVPERAIAAPEPRRRR